MTAFIAYTIIGIIFGAGYSIAASGLVLTYTTSRVFNMAHGAMAMFAAFVYYELAYRQSVPRLLAIVLVVGLIAPAFGVLMERVFMRNLAEAPVNISLTVTVGLFLLLYGLAAYIWPPDKITGVTELLPDLHVTIAHKTISGNDLLTLFCAIGIAIAFYLFFKRTRTGIAMRAVVDNRSLLALQGATPGYMSALSWAIGSALAALAGILLVAGISLEYLALTLLLFTAYGAAILGRLENLPLTFVGALVLGLANSYSIAYLPSSSVYNGLRIGIPAIFLFLVLVLLPRAPLRVGQIRGIRSVPVASGTKVVIFGALLLIGAWVIADQMASQQFNIALAFVYGSIMLSLVLLTGYGGYLNLAPIAFAGIGALTVVKLHTSSPWALFVAAGISAAVGAVIGLCAIRLGTLYLAIATLAFAELADYAVFQSDWGFTYGSIKTAPRLEFLGYHAVNDKDYVLIGAVLFVLFGALVLWLRRGFYGRLLIALRDSPAACGTLGLNLTFTRVVVFAISSAIAGFAGGIYAQLLPTFGAKEVNFIQNLPVVLAVVVCGVTSVTGAACGGFLLMFMFQTDALARYAFIVIGLAAILLSRQPNGLISYVFQIGRWALDSVLPRRDRPPASEGTPVRVPEEVTVGGSA